MKNRLPATAPHRLRLRPLALSLACMGLVPAGAQVLPSWNNYAVPLNGGTVTVGTPANLPSGGQQLGINQSSLRAIINWQSFSIGAKDQVHINQQLGASSVLLNRVVNNGPRSEIAGLLTAPGRVYVINPAGVLFGPTAQVNVGGLVASTLDIAGVDQDARNATFMAGGVLNPLTGARELSFAGPADGLGEVTVDAGASLTATGIEGRNGVVALMGAKVVNRGEINVARGSAGLLAGNQVVVIDPVGDGLTTFRIPTTNSADNARVDNVVDALAAEGVVSGRIMADGGLIALMAGSANPGATVVNQQGTLRRARCRTATARSCWPASAAARPTTWSRSEARSTCRAAAPALAAARSRSRATCCASSRQACALAVPPAEPTGRCSSCRTPTCWCRPQAAIRRSTAPARSRRR